MYPKYYVEDEKTTLMVNALVHLSATRFDIEDIRASLNMLDAEMLIEVIIEDIMFARDTIDELRKLNQEGE